MQLTHARASGRFGVIGLLAVVLAVLSVALSPLSAKADPLSSDDEAHFRSVWTQYGVSATIQDALIDTWESGGTWDSLVGETPIAEATSSSNGFATTVYTYADGSINITTEQVMPPPPGTIGPMASVHSCSTSAYAPSVTQYTCTVDTNMVIAAFGYTATFRIAGFAYDQIVSKSILSYSCYAGTCANPSVTINKALENASGPAWAQGNLEYTCYGGTCTRALWLRLTVGGNTYSASNP